MNNMGQQINDVINNLAEKFGVAAEKLYPVLIKQALIDGISGIILTVVSITVLVLALKGLIKNIPLCNENDFDVPAIKVIIYAILCFISVVGTTICLIKIKDFYTALFNPDWYALQMILDKVSGR
jgi:hypothetical protein